jgi:HTH-type transcriptional regulator/antitoxin HigA
MAVKIIKTDEQYGEAIAELESLIEQDPAEGSPERDEIEVLSLLLERYEVQRFDIGLPDPIDAIKYRMAQQNLSQRDLVPFIGGRSKVSEVLSRRRPLTLAMIRALHRGMEIPARVLLQDQDPSSIESHEIDWGRFPLSQMKSYGWIKTSRENLREAAEEIMREFFAPLGGLREMIALYRRTESHIRSARSMDKYALAAWTGRIMIKARETELPNTYAKGSITLEFMREVARQSWSDSGPVLAREYLANHGIAMVVDRHLPRTYLDGAAMIAPDGVPVVGLTIRHDRLDNFWFTLMHELAHLSLHFDQLNDPFYDDLDVHEDADPLESAADRLAGEALIPESAWVESPASLLKSPEAAQELASQLGVHPAVVAGRMRFEFKAYRLLNRLVGHKQVRALFPEVDWRG